MKLSVKMDVQAARASLKGLEREVNKAAGRALDRVATTVRKEADQEIRKRLNLKSSVVKDNLRKTRPMGRNTLVRDIEASGRPIALREYAARRTKAGATFAVKRGAGRKVYRREGRVGFINAKAGNHVFVRVEANPPGPREARVKKVFGPSIPQYFVTKLLRRRMTDAAAQRWPIEFRRELAYRKAKAGL